MNTLNTLTMARKFTTVGFSEPQAEALANMLHETRTIDVESLATKADLTVGFAELKIEIGSLRTELNSKIDSIRIDLLNRIHSAMGFQTLVIVGTIIGAVIVLMRGLH